MWGFFAEYLYVSIGHDLLKIDNEILYISANKYANIDYFVFGIGDGYVQSSWSN